MSTTQVGIKLSLDGASQAEASLRRVSGGLDGIGQSAASIKQALGGLAGAFAGVVSVREFVQAADAVTQLQNNLRLATGSAQAAGAAYEQLFAIAQRSRTNFAELGNTFASIARASESLGLSQQALLSLTETIGNAVTVSGASAQASQAALMQLGQGLASGTLRGEELNSILEQTPRLAKALADGLGVSTGALRKLGEQGKLTAEAVVQALQSQQAKLAEEVQSSVTTVGQAFTQLQNAATVLVGTVDKASGSSNVLATSIQAVAASLGDISAAFKDSTASGSGYASMLENGIGVVFETVSVLGANVAYVITGIRNELGGLAAQAVAVATGEFAQAGEIRRAMVADAEKARADVDALSDRLLNARRLRQLAEQSTAGLDFSAENARLNRQAGNTAVAPLDFSGLVGGAAKAKKAVKELGDEFASQREAAKGWADAMGDFAKIAAGVEADTLGLSKAQERLVQYLGSTAYSNASEGMRELALQQAYAAISAEQLAAALKAEDESLRAAASAWADLVEAQQANAQTAEDAVRAQLLQNEAIGLSTTALAELEAARLNDAAATKEQRAAVLDIIDPSLQAGDAYRAEAAALRALASAKTAGAAKQVAADTAKAAADEWRKASEQIEQTLTDALMRGFESGKDFAQNLRDTLVNMFRTLVLRPIISAVVNPVAGAITGSLGLAGAANAGQGGSALGTLSSLASFSSAFGAGGAAGFGALMGGGFTEAVSAGFTTLLTGGSVGTAAAGLGTLAGALGPIALGLGALSSIIGSTRGETRYGGQYGYSFDGTLADYRRGGMFAGATQGVNRITGAQSFAEAEVQGAISGTVQSINNLLKAAGSSAALVGFQAGLETSGKGRGGVFAGGTLSTGATFGEDGSGDNYAGTLFEKTSTQSPDAETALKNFALDLQQATVQALQAATDVPQAIKALVQGVDAEGLTAEAAAALLQTIDAQVTGVNQLRAAFAAMGLEQFAALGFDAASGLAAAAGGFEALGNNLASYYENFYTEAERTANTTRQLTDTLAGLGVQLPATREAFRALLEDTLASGNNDLAAQLLSLSGAFAAVVPAAEDASAAIAKAAERIAQERAGLEREYLQVTGNTAALRALELAALDESNRALKAQIYAYQDQQAAQQAAADAAQEAAQAAEQAAQAYASAFNDAQQFLDGLRNTISTWLAQQNAQAGGVQGYNSAAAAFSSQLVLARGGDRDALGGITSYASTLIDAINRESTTASEAAVRAGRVRGQLAGLPEQLRPEQFIVDNLKPVLAGIPTPIVAAVGTANAAQLAALNALGAGYSAALQPVIAALGTGFATLDTNLSGGLDLGEFRAALQGKATDAAINALFGLIDTDNDRIISAAEATAAAALTFGQQVKAGLAGDFDTLDTTLDGLLDFTEFSSAFGGLASEDTLAALFRETDTNGDGVISRLEAIAANTGGLNNGLSFNPTDPLRSVFDAILQSTALSAFYLQDASNKLNAISFYTSNTANATTAALNFMQDYSNKLNGIQYYLEGPFRGTGSFLIRGATTAFANGGVFTNQVVNGPTPFNMGLMGEAGPEAIMPLSRGADGKLGVVAQVQMPDWSQYGRSDNSAALVAEVRALREDNQAQARALVQANQRMTKILERWDGNGVPDTRVEA